MAGHKTRLKRSWKFVIAIITPLVFLPVLFANDDGIQPPESDFEEDGGEDIVDEPEHLRKSPKFKLAYIILVMAVYWALEIIPLPITAVFPLVLFPVFGIDDAVEFVLSAKLHRLFKSE